MKRLSLRLRQPLLSRLITRNRYKMVGRVVPPFSLRTFMTAIESTAIPVSDTAPRQHIGVRLWQAVMPYALILPTFLFIFTFTLWPAGSAIVQSLYKPGVTAKLPTKFVGLGNYADLFDSSRLIGQEFPLILGNTLLFVAVTVGVSIVVAFILALLLNRKMRAVGLYRFAFFYPVLMPMIGAASVFAFIFADNIGLANTVLRDL